MQIGEKKGKGTNPSMSAEGLSSPGRCSCLVSASMKSKKFSFRDSSLPRLHYIITPGCMGFLGIKFASYSSLLDFYDK
jgi:hypothetical protein